MPLDVNTIMLIAVGSLLAGALPLYPYNRNWGYAPSVFLALVFLVVLVVIFF